MALDSMFAQVQQLKKDVAFYKESMAKEHWTVRRLSADPSPEAARNTLIERKVNEMDPDFSFFREVFGETTTVPASS